MKITLFAITATFAVSFALPRANAETAETKAEPKTYLVEVDGVTIAILPANPGRTTEICCSGNATYDKVTGVSTYTDGVRLVSNGPGQAAITITGEHLTLSPQK